MVSDNDVYSSRRHAVLTGDGSKCNSVISVNGHNLYAFSKVLPELDPPPRGSGSSFTNYLSVTFARLSLRFGIPQRGIL
jgi:hypothetical protein